MTGHKWRYRVILEWVDSETGQPSEEPEWTLAEVYTDNDGVVTGWSQAFPFRGGIPADILATLGAALTDAEKFPPLKMEPGDEPGPWKYTEFQWDDDPA